MDLTAIKDDDMRRCVEFHGHICPGLTIGYRAAKYAIKLLDLKFSEDEDVVCVTENDACGVDAIQVLLGCSAGKGNLLFHMRGKQAFSFYNRTSGKSVRLVLKAGNEGKERDEWQQELMEMPDEDIFEVKEVTFKLPEKAKIFVSYPCEKCGEMTAESFIRLEDGKKLCPDCYEEYSRFS